MTTLHLTKLTEAEALSLMELSGKLPGIQSTTWGTDERGLEDELYVETKSPEAADLYLACAKDVINIQEKAAVVLRK